MGGLRSHGPPHAPSEVLSFPSQECCEPFHSAKAVPESLEQVLRARFSGGASLGRDFRDLHAQRQHANPPPSLSRGRPPTFPTSAHLLHPQGYIKGEVEYVLATDQRNKSDRDQMKRDITHACNNFVYSNLKILEQQPVASSSPEQATITFQYKVRSDVSQTSRRGGNLRGQKSAERE